MCTCSAAELRLLTDASAWTKKCIINLSLHGLAVNMARHCTRVQYFPSPSARENTSAHLCNISPYCDLCGRIKGTTRALFSIIVHACCMTNKARTISVSDSEPHTHYSSKDSNNTGQSTTCMNTKKQQLARASGGLP